MGMSASQMRYCMISGKKSDVEYQGQQINQQRTTLATQSSTLNTQLLDMSVPTPPSTSDYSKTSYSFDLGGLSCSVTGSKYDSTTGTYDVNYTYNTTGSKTQIGQSVYYKNTNAATGEFTYTTGLNANSVNTLTQVAAGDKDYATLSANLATIYGDDYDKTGETYFYSKAGDTYRFVTGTQLAAIGASNKTALSDYINNISTNGITIKGYNSNTGTWAYSDQIDDATTETDTKTTVWGDPHYNITGTNGQSYQIDHAGVAGATYNLFEGDNLKVYSTYGNPNPANNYCVITNSNITTGKSTITYNADGTASIATGGTTKALATTTDTPIDIGDGSGSSYIYKGGSLTVISADGTGSLSLIGTTVNVNGKFANLGGIVGNGTANNTSSVAQCDAQVVDSNIADGLTINGIDVKNKTYDWSNYITNNYNSADNADKIVFIDSNGNKITDAAKIAELSASYSTLSSAVQTSSATLQYAYVNEDATIQVSDKLKGAKVTWSDDGRMSAITVTDPATGEDTVYTLSVSQKTDNNAYEDAYNEYEYKKGVYDQEMNTINAKICIIQSQDKKLELKLQNLDTQQQALSTEMDSVKKVIDKNIEASFKAFA